MLIATPGVISEIPHKAFSVVNRICGRVEWVMAVLTLAQRNKEAVEHFCSTASAGSHSLELQVVQPRAAAYRSATAVQFTTFQNAET